MAKNLLCSVICIVMVLVSGCVSYENAPADKNLRRNWADDLRNRKNTIAPRLWSDTKETFSEPNNLWLLGIAGAASIVMHNDSADDSIKNSTEHHRAVDGFFSESLNWAGSPPAHFAAAGIWYALAVDANDSLNENRAWTMLSALTINSLVTVGLKGIRDNDTPNGKRWAWPSGHTSSSFCVASVLDEFYGHKVGIPAYALASIVGYRMIEEGDHWASDVVFGAALGWAVGHSVAGKHMKLEAAGFDIMPMPPTQLGQPTAGLSLVRQF